MTWPAAPRLPRVSVWVWAVVCLWLSLLAVAAGVSHYYQRPVPLCPFKRITGLACPTCGMMRGVLALGRGDVLGALSFNPLAMLGLMTAALWCGVRLVLGRRPRLYLSRRGWWVVGDRSGAGAGQLGVSAVGGCVRPAPGRRRSGRVGGA